MPQDIQSTIEQLIPIFRDVFDDEDLMIAQNTSAQDVDGWDSLAQIRLVVSIERVLGIRFSAGEIADLKNVGEMAQLILKKQINI